MCSSDLSVSPLKIFSREQRAAILKKAGYNLFKIPSDDVFIVLLPSVLAGVGSVWLVYAAVKRQFNFMGATIAGSVLAMTPVAALMFGFNNPDAILTLMLTASGYAFLRSLEGKRPLLWLGLAGLFTGLAFNAKMLQGLMVLPAMVLVYMVFAKLPIVTRFLHVMFAGAITTMSTLWWSVLAVECPRQRYRRCSAKKPGRRTPD